MAIEMQLSDDVWYAGNSYTLTVTGCISIVDYVKLNNTEKGYHIPQQQKVHFHLLNGVTNQPFQSMTQVEQSYADVATPASRSNLSDIETDGWNGSAAATITLLSTTITETVTYPTKTIYTYNPTNKLYCYRVKQTYTQQYRITLPSSLDNTGKYYFATWTHTTEFGDANEGIDDISALLQAYYVSQYLWLFGIGSEYWTLTGDYKTDPNFVNPSVYFNYTPSNLQTISVWLLNQGQAIPFDGLPVFPPDRPDGYDPDVFWIPGEWNGDVYTPPEFGQPTEGRYFATGGGRWSQQLIAIGHGTIYYEELT